MLTIPMWIDTTLANSIKLGVTFVPLSHHATPKLISISTPTITDTVISVEVGYPVQVAARFCVNTALFT